MNFWMSHIRKWMYFLYKIDSLTFVTWNIFIQMNLSECSSINFSIDGIVNTCFSRKRHLYNINKWYTLLRQWFSCLDMIFFVPQFKRWWLLNNKKWALFRIKITIEIVIFDYFYNKISQSFLIKIDSNAEVIIFDKIKRNLYRIVYVFKVRSMIRL